MYTSLKCAGQTLDAILKEHRLLQTWKAMNTNRKRERRELSNMLPCTLVIIIKKNFCNFKNFVVM